MNHNIDSNIIKSLLQNVKDKGSHWSATCPYCGDDKDHFFMHKPDGTLGRNGKTRDYLHDCKKCQSIGNLFTLLKHLNRLDLLNFSKSIDRTKKLRRLKVEQEEVVIKELDIKSLPLGYRRIYKNEYLEQRGFSQDDFKKYEIGETKIFSKLRDYIIIPIIQEQRRVGYISRYTKSKEEIKQLEQETGRHILRYKNSVDTNFGSILGGYDEITKNTHIVILVEGFFGKKNVDTLLNLWDSEEKKCCFTFGKKISQQQILLLKRKGIKNIILFYDIDAINESKKYCYELVDAKFNVLITTVLDRKDEPDNINYEKLSELMLNLYSPIEWFTQKVNIKKLK